MLMEGDLVCLITTVTYSNIITYIVKWIENSGRATAHQVQVFASKLFRRAANGSFKEDSRFLPMNLLWAHDDKVYAEGISPKMGKHCNLGRIIKPSERAEVGDDLPEVAATNTIFALFLEVKPSSSSHLLAPETYRLELKIAAANTPPVTKLLEITHTGKWFDNPEEMFRNGIGLKFID